MLKGKPILISRQQVLVIALFLAGGILLVSAFWPSSSSEPVGWSAMNGQVEQALAAVDHKEEPTKPSPVNDKDFTKVEENTGSPKTDTQLEGQVELTAVGDEKLPEASGEQGAAQKQNKQPIQADGKLDINQASAEQFDALPGIGEVKAKAIVADREKNGPFRTIDDLRRVKGIGPKLLEKLKPSIVAMP